MEKGFKNTLGDIIQDFLYVWEMSTVELSVRLGVTMGEMRELINNETHISKETAVRFEEISEVPAGVWMSLPTQPE